MPLGLLLPRWWCLLLVVGLLTLRGAVPVAAQLTWTDKRPIGLWMVASTSHLSASNPRGYLWNASLNALDAPTFHTAMMSWTTGLVDRLNSYTPRPQGVIIWDLEGHEFPGTFTYVGNPVSLPALAPEMDAIADEIFATIRNAGYRVGLTIRPQKFTWGTTFPATCTTGPTYQDWDVFLKLNDNAGPPTQRLWVCSTAPNTWTLSTSGYQRVSENDAEIYEIMRAKIQYAMTRWGASLFYIDSTGYKDGNGTISTTPFQQLVAQFPQVLIIPEFLLTATWGVTPGYADTVYQARPPAEALALYPQAFAVGPVGMAADGADSAQVQAYMRARVRTGGIMFVEAWWDNPQNQYVLEAYRAVGAARAALQFFVPR